MRTLIVGHGGRESALAWRMAESSELYAFMAHKNPSLVELVEKTGGKYVVGNVLDPEAVASFAEANKIDLAMVSADSPLEAGVIDALLKKGIRSVGPTRSGAEIEWNKTLGREILDEVAPEVNPFYRIARSHDEIEAVFKATGDMEVAIKPLGLTGGKGVKVMGPHLSDLAAAKAYAHEILDSHIDSGGAVIVEEKIVGAEFTVQAITDGVTVILPPATYDYPYRFENDQGPGTGGMGAYCARTKELPFMEKKYYDEAVQVVVKVVNKLHSMGRHFNGVLNSGFFITDKGELKVIEFNARFGDPECMNIMMVMQSNWVEVMDKIAKQTLRREDVQFQDVASTVVYLVSPDYALEEKAKPYSFELDVEAIRKMGCHVFFSSAEKASSGEKAYQTVGTSRCVGIGATGKTLQETHELINSAISLHLKGALQWRKDIATRDNIESIRRLIGRGQGVPTLG